MQEIHSSIEGGGGGGDMRLRLPHNQQPHSDHHELKCPRCDSVNTKFCYYNNYNLSQPRYFCKGCRRYWTKGGVLRNVPVGGGCRKTKRSSSKTKKSSDQSTDSLAVVKLSLERKSRSNSSSDSSSLTATAPTTESVSATSSTTPGDMCGYKSSVMAESMFSEMGTSFTSLIASSGHQSLFGFNSVLDPQNLEHGLKLQSEIPTAAECLFADQNVVEVDLPPTLRPSMFGPLDWQPNAGHQGLFDLHNAVDQAYWSQTSQWTDVDQIQPSSMYLP